MKGILFDIEHFAIHDGPGIRTTVFLQGCPLHCRWCHNPESRPRKIMTYSNPEITGGKTIERKEVVGRYYSVEEVMKEIEKDLVFYEESGGGVTFSGGEPMLQADFLLELLRSCIRKEIHTCVDTSGYVRPDKLQAVAPYIRLFLYDLKHPDEEKHRAYTGVSNKRIWENLRLLDQWEKTIQIRYPLIPGINDSESAVFRMIGFLNTLSHRYPVSILPYHKTGRSKYHRFQIEYQMEGVEEPTEDHVQQVRNYFEKAGYPVSIGG